MGLPDMRSKKKGNQKIAKEDHVAEALDKLREQTRETVKGLESLSLTQQPTGSDDAMVEDWIKQFEDLPGSNILLMLADEVEVADELWNDVIDCMMLRVRDSEDALELMVGKFCGQCV